MSDVVNTVKLDYVDTLDTNHFMRFYRAVSQ